MLTIAVTPSRVTRVVHVPAAGASLVGELALPRSPRGIVIFVEGANFSSAPAADRAIAHAIDHAGFATLRLDLLTPDEELVEDATGGLGGDIAMLSRRLIQTIDWAAEQPGLAHLPIGLFVTGPGAGAALVASVVEQHRVAAIVSTSGRLEKAGPVLPRVTTPTLLIVAGDDPGDARECEAAFRRMPSSCEMVRVHGTASRRDFAAAVEEIGRHALTWFERHLAAAPFSAGETDDAW
jgi:hypothetical protein